MSQDPSPGDHTPDPDALEGPQGEPDKWDGEPVEMPSDRHPGSDSAVIDPGPQAEAE